MPLTHVCVWDSQIGYRRVTVEEACEMFPYGVSARSGHFVCELCAQNVVLTAPGINRQHFRHDSATPNKECDERQMYFDPSYGRAVNSLSSHTMPLRLVVSGTSFSLQIGFFFPPDQNACCDRIRIAGDNHQVFEYSFERIERIGTTYLSVGSAPSKVYGVEYVNANAILKKFWANRITGVSTSGSFFDCYSGKILQAGGKAYSGNAYYLLQRTPMYSSVTDIEKLEVAKLQTSSFTTWYLYRIKVKRFSEDSAKFFLRYSVFLTERPTRYYPIWPPCVQDPYFIYHNSNAVFFYLCGDDAVLKAFPSTSKSMDTQDGKLYRLQSQGREQLVSLGKSGALGFSYLIRQPLRDEAPLPEIKITDIAGTELTEELYTTLPKTRQLSVFPHYDGKAVIKRNGRIKYVYKLTAEQSLLIDGISLGIEICLYQGCDCIRTIRFERNEGPHDTLASDDILARRLNACTGPMIPVTHRFGALALRFKQYPKTKRWIYSALRKGEIPRTALRIILDSITQIDRRGEYD